MPLKSLKILVVDDNIPVLELVSEVLTLHNVDVYPLSDSQQAATVIGTERFDGIFLDLAMPKMDGFELTRRIRQSGANMRTPIVIVSGLEERQTVHRAFSAGATFFLQKPLNKNKLVHLLNSTRGTMLQERLRSKRVPMRSEVTCQVGSRQLTATSCNLSQTGILLEAEDSLEKGNAIQLSFSFPGKKQPIKAKGFVVRVDGQQRLGIDFTYLSPSDRQRIGDFVASDEQGESSSIPPVATL